MVLHFLRNFVVLVSCLLVLMPVVSADSQEWKDPTYNFEKAKRIVIIEPKFSYENMNNNEEDRFKKYPNTKENINSMFYGRFDKLQKYKPLSRSYIEIQVKGDPDIPLTDGMTPSEFSALIDKELPKYVDLFLSLEINNYGWNYSYYDAYETTETRTEKVKYGGITPEGKEFSGWMEVPKTVTVYHSAGYTIYDNAEAKFSLINPQTQKAVWTYSDARDRLSSDWSKSYDPSGPESMMSRIFDSAFTKLPLAKKG